MRPGATTRKPRVNACSRAADSVDRLPGDEHGHDGGLARAGGELQGETHQLWVGVFVGGGKVIEQAFARLRNAARPLSARCSLDRFDLTEERADIAELVMTPMLKQARGFGRDLPLAGSGSSPLIHFCARRLMIEVGSYCCFWVERPLPSSKTISCCSAGPLRFFGFWNRRDEVRARGDAR